MAEDNPFSNSNRKSRQTGGILDIDQIIEQEKVHAHKGAVPEPVVPVEPVRQPALEPVEQQPEVEDLPIVKTIPAAEESVDDEPSQDVAAEYDDEEPESDQEPELEQESEPEPAEDAATWRPPSRRVPRLERPTLDTISEQPNPIDQIGEMPESTDDIVLSPPKNTPNRRNLILVIGAAIVIIGLIFLIPKLIEGGVLFKSGSGTTTTTSGGDTPITAGLSQDVKLKKVSDGLEADDPDNWEATFTVGSTDITLEVDCTEKPGGGTSPNLSCVGGGSSGGVVDGTFVKPFTAGEGWTYDGADYGYCFSFADKVSKQTVQSDLYGSSGIQLFYMADDFKICSKKAGDPNNTPKGKACDSQTYCPAVRLRSIK